MKQNESGKRSAAVTKWKPFQATEKKKESDAVGWLCLAATFFLPLFMIFIFVRLLITHGAPVWYLVLHGILTVLAVLQVVFFFRQGLVSAVRNAMNGRDRERSKA